MRVGDASEKVAGPDIRSSEGVWSTEAKTACRITDFGERKTNDLRGELEKKQSRNCTLYGRKNDLYE